MKPVTKSSIGFDIPVLFYENSDEADKAAGRVGALVEQGNNNLYYRAGIAQSAREIVAEVVEKRSGIKRAQSPVMVDVKDDKGNVVKGDDGKPKQVQKTTKEGDQVIPVFDYDESEEEYVKRAMAKAGLTVEALQPDVTAACKAYDEGKGLAVDIKTPERAAPKPKTLPKKYQESGDKLIANAEKLKGFLAAYKKSLNKDFAGDVKNATDLGWAVKEYMDFLDAQKLASLVG